VGSNHQPLDFLLITVERANQLRHGGYLLDLISSYKVAEDLVFLPFKRGRVLAGRIIGTFKVPTLGNKIASLVVSLVHVRAQPSKTSLVMRLELLQYSSIRSALRVRYELHLCLWLRPLLIAILYNLLPQIMGVMPQAGKAGESLLV
jgi:hypothetical protein